MNSNRPPVKSLLITIDGPAGAGKTTVSRMLAGRLGYRYIDTGALYRGIALAVQNAGIDTRDDNALGELCREIKLDFEYRGNNLRLMLNSEDVSDQIRSPQITMMASAVSARPVVRSFLLNIQRRLGAAKKAVFEGRDMGTVVFPNADVKFFLDADPGLRAKRRYEELKAKKGQCPSMEQVERDMLKRDRDDSTRQAAPLKPAPDAIRIDSTSLSIDQVVGVLIHHICAGNDSS
ncbi:MAG: (d)CMP kinase [Desulfobacteraceae bacterium]|jgi:cytidylate kinase